MLVFGNVPTLLFRFIRIHSLSFSASTKKNFSSAIAYLFASNYWWYLCVIYTSIYYIYYIVASIMSGNRWSRNIVLWWKKMNMKCKMSRENTIKKIPVCTAFVRYIPGYLFTHTYIRTHTHTRIIYVCVYWSGNEEFVRVECLHTHTHTRFAVAATVKRSQCMLYTISITVAAVADVLFLFVMWFARLLHRYLYKRHRVHDSFLHFYYLSFLFLSPSFYRGKKKCLLNFILHFFSSTLTIFSSAFHNRFQCIPFRNQHIAYFHAKLLNIANRSIIQKAT